MAVYDRHNDGVRYQTPDNTAVIGHFYTFQDETGQKRFDIESLLAQVESQASVAIEKLIAGEAISDDDRVNLSFFIAFAATRTPDHIDSVKSVLSESWGRLLDTTFANEERAKSAISSLGDAPKTDVELDNEARDLVEFVKSKQYIIEADHQVGVGFAISSACELAPILYERHWVVAHNANPRSSYVVSDAPVILSTVIPRKGKFVGVGYANIDALVSMPLSMDTGLVLFGKGQGLEHTSVSSKTVRHANMAQAHNCQRFLIGRHKALVESLAKRLKLGSTQWRPKYRTG